eukprot:6096942-Prymnesium_polylepis.1
MEDGFGDVVEHAAPDAEAPPPCDVVLRDVAVALSEEDIVKQLESQALTVGAVVRFRRTAKGKPPKALPMCRLQGVAAADVERLLTESIILAGVRCKAERAQRAADSASAAGWQATAGAEGVWRTRSAVEAVAPLQDVPYEEQLRRKGTAVLDELRKLPEAMRLLGASLDPPDMRRAAHALPWLQPEALRAHEGSPCPIAPLMPSPLEVGYRNKAEFSIGCDADGAPCVGFVLGQVKRQTQHVTIGEPSACRLLSEHMRAAVARVQAAVRASALLPFDRIANEGFWLQLTARQAFNDDAGALPALLLLLSVKTHGHEPSAVDGALATLRAALESPPLQPAVRLSLCVQRDPSPMGCAPCGPIEPIVGEPWLDERLGALTYRVSPTSFFQARAGARRAGRMQARARPRTHPEGTPGAQSGAQSGHPGGHAGGAPGELHGAARAVCASRRTDLCTPHAPRGSWPHRLCSQQPAQRSAAVRFATAGEHARRGGSHRARKARHTPHATHRAHTFCGSGARDTHPTAACCGSGARATRHGRARPTRLRGARPTRLRGARPTRLCGATHRGRAARVQARSGSRWRRRCAT